MEYSSTPVCLAWLSAAVLLSACLLAGCASPLPAWIVDAPNRTNPLVGDANPLPPVEALAGASEHFSVKVGPPAASLSVCLVEPGPQWQPPRGTVLVVHGIFTRSMSMMSTARMLAGSGYRAVLVDLRGHGRSTGKFLTYGVQEAKDLSQVIDELQRRGLVSGKIGVFGISYGATTAIHLAACDPRVEAVVAVAPFSTMRDAVPHFGRAMIPALGAAIPEETYQRAIDEAGRRAQFDPDEANAVAAIQQTPAPVLIVHGTNDRVVPHWHGARLHEAAPDHSEFVSMPGVGHAGIWCDPTGEVAQRARAWFERWL